MVLSRDGMETKVCVLPYVESSIDKGAYIQATEKPLAVSSVRNYEDTLVEVVLPGGAKVIAKAEQLITAIQKCIM